MHMSEMCGWLVGLPAPAPACMCGVEGSRPQPLTLSSLCVVKETESGEARAVLTIAAAPEIVCPLPEWREVAKNGLGCFWGFPPASAPPVHPARKKKTRLYECGPCAPLVGVC